MSTTINTDEFVLQVDPHTWKIFSQEEHTVFPLFTATRGDTVVYYSAWFGEKMGFPGDRLAIDYIRAVMVGYHAESQKWILGLHVSQTENAKPIFRKLVDWSDPERMTDIRYAARKLASLLVCPLKIFGEKKLPAESNDPMRSGMTGPLQPHLRTRVDKDDIRRLVRGIKLPIKGDNFEVNVGKNGVVVRLDKQLAGGDEDVPVFNMVEFNVDKNIVRLIPPTGLLSMFIGSGAKNIPFKNIFNAEFRYYKVDIGETVPSADKKMMEERLSVRHVWGLFLTMQGESLLLLKSSFAQSPDLLQTRAETVGRINKLETNSIEGITYFRRTLEEQNLIEQRQNVMEQASYIIAHAVGCAVVKTQFET